MTQIFLFGSFRLVIFIVYISPLFILDSFNLFIMFPHRTKALWKTRDRRLRVSYSTHDQEQECQERSSTQLSLFSLPCPAFSISVTETTIHPAVHIRNTPVISGMFFLPLPPVLSGFYLPSIPHTTSIVLFLHNTWSK